ncbi:MAG: hypothetical protein GXP27_09995, partial [Planctomycetes bacterium]|nr:hypothetical protein [Planctomycetota bacterium]
SSDAWQRGVLHIGVRDRGVDVVWHIGGDHRVRLRSAPLRNGVWYHMAVVADTSRGLVQLFTNGYPVDAADISRVDTPIKLVQQVVGRESRRRYFRGAIDEVRLCGRALTPPEVKALCPDAPPPDGYDRRNIRTGYCLPDEGYCDQPYTVVLPDGRWLCTLTTGPGREGQRGQHIVATLSSDHGQTWSDLIDIEPSGEREASWVMPLLTPSGRVYVFYTYNAENIHTLPNGKPIRADTLGWYVFKYSDDGGRTWSEQRYRLPLRVTAVDRANDFGGRVQYFWGIGKPIAVDGWAIFAFSKVGKIVVDDSEGWFFRSDNVLTEPDPAKVRWVLLPDGDRGLEVPEYGDVHAEQNLVALSDGSLYCMYRTVTGHPFHAYSRDRGHTWTKPEPATYTPGGRKFKHPRACPRIWRTHNGRFLFWFHNNSVKGWQGRNPVWISGGLEKDGFIHWSQPELLLYDPESKKRVSISYPDLIEQDGRYWITETQKSIARVHEIDPTLLEGLWNQGRVREVTRKGLALERAGGPLKATSLELPRLNLERTGGLTIEMWLRLNAPATEQTWLSTRASDGSGWRMSTTDAGTVRIEIGDGKAKAAWDCDQGLLSPNKLHHVVVIVDARARVISFVIDGVLCDGGTQRPYGWLRYHDQIADVTGTGRLRISPPPEGELHCLRVYSRYLRTSEVIGNFHAGAP